MPKCQHLLLKRFTFLPIKNRTFQIQFSNEKENEKKQLSQKTKALQQHNERKHFRKAISGKRLLQAQMPRVNLPKTKILFRHNRIQKSSILVHLINLRTEIITKK